MITRTKQNKLIERSYTISKEHGFHEKELSIRHMMMLVLTEVSEAVDADRKCDKKSCLKEFDEAIKNGDDFAYAFITHIKDTCADELADVCIRLYDLCGATNLKPRWFTMTDAYYEMWLDANGKDEFCEQCFTLSRILTRNLIDSYEQLIGFALEFTYNICKFYDIDIERHIELKMKYNETRPYKHGKAY